MLTKELRSFLTGCGLKLSANDSLAVDFWKGLSGPSRMIADKLGGGAPEAVAVSSATPGAGVVAGERRRLRELATLGKEYNMPQSWVDEQIHSGAGIEQARASIFDALAKPDGTKHYVKVGEDRNVASLRPALVDALTLRACGRLVQQDERGNVIIDRHSDGSMSTRPRDAHPRARQFEGDHIADYVRALFRAIGVPRADELASATLLRAAFSAKHFNDLVGGAVSMHSSSNFDSVLRNVAQNVARMTYAEYPVAWPVCFRREFARDFKTQYRTALGDAPNLSEIKEGGPYQQVSISDLSESFTLVKYGEQFVISWESLINDQLDLFEKLPQFFGAAARRLEDQCAFSVLVNNGSMSDGTALFHSDHANVASGVSVDPPSVASLNEMRRLMRVQTGPGGSTLNIDARFIICPCALEGTVKQLLTSTTAPDATAAGVANVWHNALVPVFHPTLDASSTAVWYTAADPNIIDTISVVFLESETQPVVESKEMFETDGRAYKVRHSVCAKALDWRGVVRNDGT